MKPILLTVLTALFFTACKKPGLEVLSPPPPSHPQMIYHDLKNAEVKYRQLQKLDIDNDGIDDFAFSVLLVGDPVLQRDRMQFSVHSGIKHNLLNNAIDESPKLNKMDTISKKHEGYTWWEISSIVLAEKIITNTNTYWDGLWKNANHNYLPIQIEKNGKLYRGWIELSFSTADEKLILHKAALSIEEDKAVLAGY